VRRGRLVGPRLDRQAGQRAQRRQAWRGACRQRDGLRGEHATQRAMALAALQHAPLDGPPLQRGPARRVERLDGGQQQDRTLRLGQRDRAAATQLVTGPVGADARPFAVRPVGRRTQAAARGEFVDLAQDLHATLPRRAGAHAGPPLPQYTASRCAISTTATPATSAR
jgi:hypothetical protein